VSVVNEPVEDRIGVSRIANEGVPLVDRDLTGKDGRATPIAFLEDLVECGGSGFLDNGIS